MSDTGKSNIRLKRELRALIADAWQCRSVPDPVEVMRSFSEDIDYPESGTKIAGRTYDQIEWRDELILGYWILSLTESQAAYYIAAYLLRMIDGLPDYFEKPTLIDHSDEMLLIILAKKIDPSHVLTKLDTAQFSAIRTIVAEVIAQMDIGTFSKEELTELKLNLQLKP